ncbi:structural protein [Escherichia phage UB]|uniref:Structural protein n=1 Tax=Escherichia phage UB TaxID=2268588 RepID=A0A2Z5H9M4_9CAUD|nr:structural protein [Escherichia phage UB]
MADLRSTVDNFQNDITSITGKAKTTASNALDSLKATANTLQNDVKTITKNNYKANVSNVVTLPKQSASVDQVYEDLDLSQFVIPYDNKLLKYDNPTWHFCLFALDKDDFKNFWLYPDAEVQRHVISESGVTGKYNITSVQMTQAGPSTPGMTTNYCFNTAVLNMSENNSMSLYDELISLSNKLRYHKFMDLPLILELKFIGFNKNGIPEIIPETTRRWSVKINSVTASASQSGSTMMYTMNLVHNRAALVDNIEWTLKEPFNCTAENFGDFCFDLEDKLNQMADQQYGYLRYKFGELSEGKFFEFKVAPDLQDLFINYDSKQMAEAGTTKSGAQGSKNFSWNPSTPISRIIDDVIDTCTVQADDSTSVRQFVNIIPVKQYVGFDNYRNTSVYKVIFYIVRFKIGDIVHESDLQPENFTFEYFFENAEKYVDPNDQKPKINMKTYNYQFSGLNSEIIDLDLKFDQQFFVATTRNPGPIQDVANHAGTHTSQELNIQGVQYNSIPDAWAKTSDLRVTRDLGGMLTQAQQQLLTEVETLAKNQMQVGNAEEQDRYNNYQVNVLPQYIEDYVTTYEENDGGTDGVGHRYGEVFTMPTEATNNETTLSASLNDNSSTYEMDRRKIRDNYYNRPFLCKLDMRVVGDPYWLGWSDYSYLQYLEQVINGEDMEINPDDYHVANYITSEAYLLLKLQPVISINDNTGVLDINTPTTFNQTIYRVNKIVHDFGAGGSFTQQIQAAIVIRALKRHDSIVD